MQYRNPAVGFCEDCSVEFVFHGGQKFNSIQVSGGAGAAIDLFISQGVSDVANPLLRAYTVCQHILKLC